MTDTGRARSLFVTLSQDQRAKSVANDGADEQVREGSRVMGKEVGTTTQYVSDEAQDGQKRDGCWVIACLP